MAVGLAARLGSTVRLVHAMDTGLFSLLDENRRDYLFGLLRKKLSAEADRLRATGAKVDPILAEGSVHRVLAELADRERSALIAASCACITHPRRWLTGSVAERTAQSACVPTLAIREAKPLLAWVRGEKDLNIFLGYDFSASSDAALRFLAALKKIGSCRVTVTYVSWPPHEAWRLGLAGRGSLAENSPEVQRLLEDDLRERCRAVLGSQKAKLRVLGSWGDISSQLVELAKAEETDLIILGTNQRTGLDRFWLGSVSRDILCRAPVNVVCIPSSAELGETPGPLAAFKRVLVPTDMTRASNKAIAHGYRAVQRGAEVLLVHVTPPNWFTKETEGNNQTTGPGQKRTLLEHLQSPIPLGSQKRGVRSRVEVVEHQHPAVSICQTAERCRADLICMASRGRVVLGSAAESVMRRSRRPVLVIRD